MIALPPDSQLAVLEIGPVANHRRVLVECSCGVQKWMWLDNVRSGTSKSCGCMRWKHGDAQRDSRARLHRIWTGIRGRTSNPKNTAWKYYGGKGVGVTPEWDDYAVFREWALGSGYSDDLTIDRINNDGDYEPANCRWISQGENSRKACEYRYQG